MLKWPRIKIIWGDEPSPVAPTPNNNVESAQASSDLPEEQQPKKHSLFYRVLGFDKQREKPRPLILRLLSLKIGSAINLVIWCVVAGIIMRLTNFNLLNPQIDAAQTTANVWGQGWTALKWLVINGWKPALTGATLILPVWLTWRIITLPFRR